MALRRIALLGLALPFFGCGEAEQSAAGVAACPSPGALVIAEVMANPPGADQHEWVEVQNVTDGPVDLAGLTFFIESVGTNSHPFSRGRVEPGALFVLGSVSDAERPGFIDYGYGDALGFMPNAAAVLGVRCGEELIDAAGYIAPVDGMSSVFDGALSPDAVANDAPGHWCESTHEYEGQFFGSPGLPNDACLSPAQRGLCAGEQGYRDIVPPKPGDLRITEYMADPVGAKDSAGEWIEVWVDAGVGSIDLNGLEVRVGSSAARIESDTCRTVKGGDYLILARSEDSTINGGLPFVTAALSFGLPNGGSTIALHVDSQVDALDSVPYDSSEPGVATKADQAYEAGVADVVWCEATLDEKYSGTDRGTPGAANGYCPPVVGADECLDQGAPRKIDHPKAGEIFISEVMANPKVVDDSGAEWIELHLLEDADLNGLTIGVAGGSSVIIQGINCISRAAGSQVLLARKLDPGLNGGLPDVDYVFSFGLVNGGGQLELGLSDGGVVLHTPKYPSATAGEAWSLDPATAGSDPEVWCAAVDAYGPPENGNKGTPKATNPSCGN